MFEKMFGAGRYSACHKTYKTFCLIIHTIFHVRDTSINIEALQVTYDTVSMADC